MGQEHAVPVLYFHFVSSGPHLDFFFVLVGVMGNSQYPKLLCLLE